MTNQNHMLLLSKISIIALIIGAISLPLVIELSSPLWMLVCFVYWVIYTDGKWIYLSALILGLLMDVLQGGILGQNAFALVISSAFIFNVKKSFFVSNLTTQQVYIFIGSLIYLITFLLTHILVQGFDFSWLILISPFSSAIIWPVIRFLLAKLKH
ncbi:MAG: rod shape-determining protein MreD [Candidatus Pseudothioglobus sp.]|jgi:rod shape-determining protein MreD|tara:strand:+ start:98 stop:565 length:468 start_codon:yes stop_codon:yes gene_type:complete